MEIIVCIRRVPDLSEAEIEIGRDGVSLDDDDPLEVKDLTEVLQQSLAASGDAS